MEDRHVVETPLDPSLSQAHLLAVFDGHRGPEAAQFCAENVKAAFSHALTEGSAEACLKVVHLALSTFPLHDSVFKPQTIFSTLCGQGPASSHVDANSNSLSTAELFSWPIHTDLTLLSNFVGKRETRSTKAQQQELQQDSW